jgi:hypothetical protein
VAMIEVVARAAEAALAHTPWRLERVDASGRGKASFKDDKSRLIFEIGYWWPEGAHHLDDEPGVLLRYQEGDSPGVQVPYLADDRLPDLRWSASPDDIGKATRALLHDFEDNFLAVSLDRRTVYNRVIERWLELHGIVDTAIFGAIKRALDYDQVTTVTWAERKLSILRQRILDGGSVLAFDPAVDRMRTIDTVEDFNAYVAASFGRRE